MAEKGNTTAATAEAAAGSGGLMSALGGTASATAVQASETLRDKVIGRAVDHGIDEARDRLRERRDRNQADDDPQG